MPMERTRKPWDSAHHLAVVTADSSCYRAAGGRWHGEGRERLSRAVHFFYGGMVGPVPLGHTGSRSCHLGP